MHLGAPRQLLCRAVRRVQASNGHGLLGFGWHERIARSHRSVATAAAKGLNRRAQYTAALRWQRNVSRPEPHRIPVRSRLVLRPDPWISGISHEAAQLRLVVEGEPVRDV